MLISIKISRNSDFLGSDKPKMLFFQLINFKMPTIVGISTFMSRKKSYSVELSMKKSFITSRTDIVNVPFVWSIRKCAFCLVLAYFKFHFVFVLPLFGIDY